MGLCASFLALWCAENAQSASLYVNGKSGSGEQDSRKGRQAVLTEPISQGEARDVRQNSLALSLRDLPWHVQLECVLIVI